MANTYVGSMVFEGNKSDIDAIWKDCVEYRDKHMIPSDEEKQKGKESHLYYGVCNLTRSSDTKMGAVFIIDWLDVSDIFYVFIDKYKEVFINTYYYVWENASTAVNTKYYRGEEVYVNTEFDCSNNEFYEFQYRELYRDFELVKTTDEGYSSINQFEILADE